MLLISFYVALLGAVTCTAQVIAPNSPYNIQQCNENEERVVSDGLDEAMRMLQTTHDRLAELYTWFAKSPSVPLDTSNNAEEMSVYRTWQTLYQRPLHNQTVIYSDDHRLALDRIGDVMNLTQAMANTINGSVADFSHPLQIFCGTQYLRRTSGERYPDQLQQVLFDNRPSNMVGKDAQNQRKWVTMPGMNGSFEEELVEGKQGLPPFVAFDDMAGPYKTVLSVNKQYFPVVWNATANPEMKSYDDINNEKIDDNVTYHLKDQVNNHISALLIEILSQLAGVTDGKPRVYSTSCKLPNEPDPPPQHDDKPNPAVFGWYCAEWLGKISPDTAQKAAQNFMFLNVALYMRSRDWSKGFARPPTEAQKN